MTAAFYFDLASPDAYIAAERVLGVLPGSGGVARPVLARGSGPGSDPRRPAGDGAGDPGAS